MLGNRFIPLFVLVLGLVGSSSLWAENRGEGRKIYLTYCSGCHGGKGKGDGPVASSLPVKPADHTNGALMNQLPDTFLYRVISKGGSGVGKSTFMPAWGAQLKEKQIRELIAYIRSLAVPPYGSPAK